LDNFEELFFVNLDCDAPPKALTDANECNRDFSSIQPEGAIVKQTDSTTGIEFYEGGPAGYDATATLAACTPKNSDEAPAAVTIKFS